MSSQTITSPETPKAKALMQLDSREEAAALRCLELLFPLTLFLINEAEGHTDRLALRVALNLLLARVNHPTDDSAAKRIECVIRAGLAK